MLDGERWVVGSAENAGAALLGYGSGATGHVRPLVLSAAALRAGNASLVFSVASERFHTDLLAEGIDPKKIEPKARVY